MRDIISKLDKILTESAVAQGIQEVSLGDYRAKALKQKAQSQMGAMFARDPEQQAKDLSTFNKRERGLNRLKDRDTKSRADAQAKDLADLVARLPELKSKYEQMKDKYKSLGGSNWQYADREQNLTDREREARSMEGPMNNLWRQIQAAEKSQAASEDFELGDDFGISFSEDFEIATEIVDILEDGVVIALDEHAIELLAAQGLNFLEGELEESVAGPKKCWKGYRKTGTQSGTGKNAGKRVNDCEKIGEGLDESGLQRYTGIKKYGKDGFEALQKAGREGADEEEKGRIKDKYLKKEDHGPENPDAPVNHGEYDREGDMAKDDLRTIDDAAEELYSILQADENLPEWVQSKITKAVDYIDTARDYMKAQKYEEDVEEGAMPASVIRIKEKIRLMSDAEKKEYFKGKTREQLQQMARRHGYGENSNVYAKYATDSVAEGHVDEAKYQGREVPLGKKMAGDVKKSKVYVRKPNGNIVKVNFGDKKMRIKKSNPARRKSFRARHNCANPGPRHKARYWSCRSW